ncbi:hypothetical protein PVAND_008072 [Polypedilum vanderplanki]|uniref:Uncharacterized protein n=1 Tax=Polypedilum vanderplanki TaxID=319348 RepID=A0A9J6C9F0_POLVA|nr:hypothetical protein PVAND_008072 [Polypedilum vanderplanki]
MDVKCIFVLVFIIALLSMMKVNNRLERYTLKLNENFRNINSHQLYEFVMRNPHALNKWMDSISYFMESNERPHSVGKIYEVFIGIHSTYLITTEFNEGKSITLQSNSYYLFHSSFQLKFLGKCNSSALQIEHNFNIDSLLFQKTLGDILRKFLEVRLQRALKNLKLILNNLQSDGFLLY